MHVFHRASDEAHAMTDDEVLRLIMTKLAVPVWPVAGKALGLGRNAAYEAATRGDIPTVPVGGRRKPVPTSWLRCKLGLVDDTKTA
jgi:hypothetical protein